MSLRIEMITVDCAEPQKLADFWTKALDMTVALDVGEFVMLAPVSGDGPRLGLQRVPEPRLGKNRVHIDVHTADREAEVRRLMELGATAHNEHEVPGLAWTVMTDPEGNEFCIGTG